MLLLSRVRCVSIRARRLASATFSLRQGHLLGPFQGLLLRQCLLLLLELIDLALVFFVAFFGEGEQVLVQLEEGHGAADLVDAIVLASRPHDHARLSIREHDSLRDEHRAAHVRRVVSSSKFLDQPAVVLLFVLVVVALVERHCILLLDPLDLLHDALLQDEILIF